MNKILPRAVALAALLALFAPHVPAAQKIYWGDSVPAGWNGKWPAKYLTVPEKTNYTRTASSTDVLDFIDALRWSSDKVYVINMFTTTLRRTCPAVVLANPRVCFTVAELGRLLPADTAMEFSNEFASVVVFGQARLVESEAEKRRALQALLDKYFPDLRPGADYRPMTEAELNATAVYAIEIEAWSGKQKVAPQ